MSKLAKSILIDFISFQKLLEENHVTRVNIIIFHSKSKQMFHWTLFVT